MYACRGIGRWLKYLYTYLFSILGYLEKTTLAIVDSFHLQSDENLDRDYLKVLTNPLTKFFIQVKNRNQCKTDGRRHERTNNATVCNEKTLISIGTNSV